MKVSILDRIMRGNVRMFLKLLERMKQKKTKELAQRTLAVYIDKKSGKLQLDDHATPERWKMVRLRWDAQGAHPLEIVEQEASGSFQYKDLDPAALRRLADTVKTLNRLAFDPSHKKSSEELLQDIEIIPCEDLSMIQHTWVNIDRQKAEQLLLGSEPGTYLFRKGEYAEILEKNLNHISSKPTTCMTLTFSEPEGKISERIFVNQGREWLFYDDDPALKNACYLTLEALLETMGDRLRIPLIR